MDFAYPPEAEKFREELRAWLAANLTDDVSVFFFFFLKL